MESMLVATGINHTWMIMRKRYQQCLLCKKEVNKIAETFSSERVWRTVSDPAGCEQMHQVRLCPKDLCVICCVPHLVSSAFLSSSLRPNHLLSCEKRSAAGGRMGGLEIEQFTGAIGWGLLV